MICLHASSLCGLVGLWASPRMSSEVNLGLRPDEVGLPLRLPTSEYLLGCGDNMGIGPPRVPKKCTCKGTEPLCYRSRMPLWLCQGEQTQIGSGNRFSDRSDGLAIDDAVGGGCRFRPFCGRRPRRSLGLALRYSFGSALCHPSAAHPPPILFLSRGRCTFVHPLTYHVSWES
jgi:hypothetical protein